MVKTKMIEFKGKLREHIWSDVAYDYSSKMTVTPLGTMTYEKTGTWVLSMKALQEMMKEDE